MMQMQTTLGERVARLVLWVGLVGLPLLFYLAVILLDAVGWFDTRGSIGVTLQVYGWPILLVGVAAYCLLAGIGAISFRWPAFRQWWQATGLGQPLLVGLGAYLLGSLLQMMLPEAMIFPFGIHKPLLTFRLSHWWPLENMSLAGYTIYPPLDARFVLMPQSEAACFKLGALLATLLFYRRSHSRASAAPSAA